MKCFRLLILSLLLSNLSLAQEMKGTTQLDGEFIVGEVLPAGEERKITNGEIYYVKIRSELTNEKLKEFENRRINTLMYVIKFLPEGDERIFKLFVTDPPKTKPGKKTDIKTYFKMDNFRYIFDKTKTANTLAQLDVPYELEKESSKIMRVLMLILVGMLLIPTGWFGAKLFQSRMIRKKERKTFKRIALDYLTLMQNARVRDEYEKIYAARKEIRRYLDLDEALFSKLLVEIDNYQYQAEWSETIFKSMQGKLEKVQDCRINRGI